MATIVRGGHSLTGRRLAPLDTEAVRGFARGCGLTNFAVTATGSTAVADDELAVAEIVAAEVPGARITLSYEFGSPGLREREDDAIRNAGLGLEAGRIADGVARVLAGVPVFFARSGSGLVSAGYFRRYPLVSRLGGTASLARGRAALATGGPPEAPADPAAGRPGGFAGGRPGGLTSGPAGGPASGWAGDPATGRPAARAAGGRPGVRTARPSGEGAGEGEAPDGVAAAYGAALAEPEAQVERLVQVRGQAELDRALQEARDEVLTRVVSAGGAPGSARIEEITVNPLSYLPEGLYRIRVTSAGATP